MHAIPSYSVNPPRRPMAERREFTRSNLRHASIVGFVRGVAAAVALALIAGVSGLSFTAVLVWLGVL